MSEKEISEQPADEVQLEDIVKDAPVVSQQENLKEPEESAKPSVDEKSTEVIPETEKTEESEKIEEPETKSEETAEKEVVDEKSEEPKTTKDKPKYSDDDIETWRKDSENKSNWQKSLTKKSQAINKYDDEQLATIEATAQLMDKMKDFKPEPLPEAFTIKDEFGEDVKIKSDIIKPHIDKILENAKNQWIEEFAPQLKDAEKFKAEAEQATAHATNQAALVRMEQYFGDYPEAAFSLGGDPVEMLNDINSAGPTHPDYKKLLNLNAVAQRAAAMGIGMKEAHIDLFGKSEQIKKAEKTIEEEQKAVQTEKPGKTGKVITEDEKFNKEMNIGQPKKENAFD